MRPLERLFDPGTAPGRRGRPSAWEGNNAFAASRFSPGDRAHVAVCSRRSGLGYDTTDDQQDIVRGKGMVDELFQGKGVGMGTQARACSALEHA